MKPYYQDDKAGITIWNADCRHVLPTLAAGSVDLVLTDPPYGTGLDATDVIVSPDIWADIGRLAKSIVMLIGYARNLFDWATYMQPRTLIGYIVWYKPHNPLVSPGLTRIHEDVAIWGRSITELHSDRAREPYRADPSLSRWFGSLGGRFTNPDPLSNRLGGDGPNENGRRCTDLWEIVPNYAGFNSHLRLHPHQKPLELVSRLISLATEVDSIILDPFMGSGTTLRAAKDLGRKAIGIEIEERYCEIAVQRLQQEVMAL